MSAYQFKFKRKVPAGCCPFCAEPVGLLGRFFAWVFGLGFHDCSFSNVIHPPGFTAEDLAKAKSSQPRMK